MLDINWQQVLGPLLDGPAGLERSELLALTDALKGHSPRAVRLSPTSAASDLPFATEPIPWFQSGRRLTDSTVRPGAYLEYAAGKYYIQDAGSMLALRLADVRPGQSVCDTCAAPGGKASGLLEQLGNSGILLANEVIRSRLDVLSFALSRVGAANYMITNLELEALSDLCYAAFDCVLVDAPCTGQSLVARGKQSLAAFSARQIEHSAARQQRILRSAAELVQPGGRLIYSTCTFAFAENEQMIEWLRTIYPTWNPVVIPELLPWHNSQYAGCYRLWPHRDHCDGAFAAALQRPADDASSAPINQANTISLRPTPLTRATKHHGSFDPVNSFVPVNVPVNSAPREFPWLHFSETTNTVALWRSRHELHYFAKEFPTHWISHAYAGVPVAQDRASQWQPAYAASVVSFNEFKPRATLELSQRQAAEYLDGAALRIGEHGLQPAQAGWTSVSYLGRPLGWGKFANGVLKNHLPKSLRKPLSSIVVDHPT